MNCNSCRETVAETDRFCRQCGARVAVSGPVEQAERRVLTVLFCDLVGSTEISRRLDPEEVRELVQMYQAVCTQEVERYGGYIAQYLGDGILVYFGYPEAHEDAAERSVLAGLAMRDEVKRLSQEIHATWGIPLAVRVGIHSGLVVVGEVGAGQRKEHLALGDTPNIAARIQGQAGSGEVLVSEETFDLASGRFVAVDRGTPNLAGVGTALRLFVVNGVRSHSLFDLPSVAVTTYGRDSELAALREVWKEVSAGVGQLVHIAGEAGLGKSHLVWSFVNEADHLVAELACSELQTQTPLWPFSNWLVRGHARGQRAASDLRAALEADLLERDLSTSLLPGLCALVGVDHPDIPSDPGAARLATTEALLTYALAVPGIFVCEDLHWADASTLDVLASLHRRSKDTRIMLLVTSRNPSHWAEADCPTRCLNLAPLDTTAARALLRDCLGLECQEALLDRLISCADGMPMFLHQLAAAAQEAKRDWGEFDVPTSLQSLLMTRLDRVGSARRVAQEGAVLGRHFSLEQLRAITLTDKSRLSHELTELQRADIIQRSMTADGPAYHFRHSLLRAVAYGSLLRRARAQIHRRVALHIEDSLGAVKPNRQTLGLLAHHFVRSLHGRTPQCEDVLKAVGYLLQAAKAALALSAYKEAEADLRQAHALVQGLPEEAERWHLELAIHKDASVVHRATLGYAAPEVEQDLRGARAICEKLGEQREVASVSLAIWSLLLGRGDYSQSLRVAAEVLGIATAIGDEALQLRAFSACGNSEFWLGNIQQAFLHANAAVGKYCRIRHGAGLAEHGWDAGVHGYMVATWSAWLLGRSDVLEYEARLQNLAHEINHPLTTAIAENTSCVLHVLRRDSEETIKAAERLNDVAGRYGLSFYRIFGDLFRTAGLVRQGAANDDFAKADEVFTFYQARLGGLAQTFVASFMAIVYASKGQEARALEVVRWALEAAERCDEHVFERSLRRQESLLSGHPTPPLSDIEICGALSEGRRSLSPNDPNNHWIGQVT